MSGLTGKDTMLMDVGSMADRIGTGFVVQYCLPLFLSPACYAVAHPAHLVKSSELFERMQIMSEQNPELVQLALKTHLRYTQCANAHISKEEEHRFPCNRSMNNILIEEIGCAKSSLDSMTDWLPRWCLLWR